MRKNQSQNLSKLIETKFGGFQPLSFTTVCQKDITITATHGLQVISSLSFNLTANQTWYKIKHKP
jgi:hypothetical protein